MDQNLEKKRKTVEFLYNGLIIFYPEDVASIFALDRKKTYPVITNWGQFSRSEFAEFVFNTTGVEDDLENAARIVKRWKEELEKNTPYPARDIPEELENLVYELERAKERKLADEEIRRIAKETQLESQRHKEKELKKAALQEEPAKTIPVQEEAQEPAKKIEETTEKEAIETKAAATVPNLPQETVVFVKAKEETKPIELSTKEARVLRKNIALATRDPVKFSNKATQAILKNRRVKEITKETPPEVKKVVARAMAVDLTCKLYSLGKQIAGKKDKEKEKTLSVLAPPTNPVWVLSAISDPANPELAKIVKDEEVRKVLIRSAKEVGIEAESFKELAKAYLTPILGEKITNSLYGLDQKVGYELSQIRLPGFSPVYLNNILALYSQQSEAWKDLKEGVGKLPDRFFKLASDSFDFILKNLGEKEKLVGLFSRVKNLFSGFKLELSQGNIYTASQGFLKGLGTEGLDLLKGRLLSFFNFQNIPFSSFLPQSLQFTNLFGAQGFAISAPGEIAAITSETLVASTVGEGTTMLAAATTEVATGLVAETATGALAAGGTAVAGEAVATGVGVAAGSAGGAAVGQAALPFLPLIGAAIGAILGWLLGKLKDIFSWLKRHKDDLAPVLFGGAMIGGVAVGGIFGGALALGGLLGLAGSLAAKAGGLGSVAASAAGYGQAIMTGVTSVVVPAIGIPAIIAIIATPIVVAVILFIINSGAYIVPPGDTIPTFNQGGIAAGNCPLVGPTKISMASYDPYAETGHGSNAYWPRSIQCSYSIPINAMGGCYGPSEPPGSQNNVCKDPISPEDKPLSTCPYYGLAVDVKPQDQASFPDVVLPALCDAGSASCPSMNWTIEQGWFNCGGGSKSSPAECTGEHWGWGVVFTSDDNGHRWKLYLNHIDPASNIKTPITPGGSFPSGAVVGKITQDLAPSSHTHIELNVDGVPVKPDFLCGGTTAIEGLNGWVIETPIDQSNIVASSPSEFSQKTCDWSASKSLSVAVNANYFNSQIKPEGPAGFNGLFTYVVSQRNVEYYSFVIDINGQGKILKSSELPGNFSNYKLAVSGIPFYPTEIDRRARTALGISSGKLYLMTLIAATAPEIESAIKSAGAEQAIMLDGGGSTTLCEANGVPVFGNTIPVGNSIGVKSGIIKSFSR